MSDPRAHPVHIEAQGHVLKIRCPGRSWVPGAVRGKVREFSLGSRRRLKEKLARISSKRQLPTFLTLTYPADYPDHERAKRDLFTIVKRLRRYRPTAAGVWRMEDQERGAPHFHIILWGVRWLPIAWVRRSWSEVIGYAGSPQLQIKLERIRSWRGVASYVDKYIAKMPEQRSSSPAAASIPIAGADQVEPAGGAGVAPALLDNVAYLTDDDDSQGRVWGVFNNDGLPWGELVQKARLFGSWFYRLLHAARGVYPLAGQFPGGYTLYLADPYLWAEIAREIPDYV